MTSEARTNSERETFELGEKFAEKCAPGVCVLLSGSLGAGKTVFIRGVAHALGVDEKAVRSPTFTLVNEYTGGKIPIAHADLYRLEGYPDAANRLFLHEYIDDGFLLLVEWAQWGVFAPPYLKIDIEQDSETARVFRFSEVLS